MIETRLSVLEFAQQFLEIGDMTTASKFSFTAIERRIFEDIKAEKLKLRFDRVVLRLTGDLKAHLSSHVADRRCIVCTVTAPIREPAKTARAIESIVLAGLPRGEARKTLCGNRVRIRSLVCANNMPKVIAFVHNRDTDAGLFMKVVESYVQAED